MRTLNDTLFINTHLSSQHSSEHYASFRGLLRRWYNSHFINQESEETWLDIKHTVSCLSSKTLSENQLCISWSLNFSFQNISLHFEHLHRLIQNQLKLVEKLTFDPNLLKVLHFVDFSCLASYFTVHTRGHFTTATSDNWGSKHIIWRHIHIPLSFLIEQTYTFSTSRLMFESQFYTVQWTGSLFNTLKYEELVRKGLSLNLKTLFLFTK